MCRLVLFLLVILAVGCNDRRRPVPRPEAYPRFQLPDPEYVRAPGLPLAVDVNSCQTVVTADTAGNGAVWLTVDYPLRGASIYLTFTPAESESDVSEVAANRYERISRDMGRGMWKVDAQSDFAPFTVYSSDAVIPTPAAAILICPGWVVSGSVALRDGAYISSPDSLEPVRDYVMEDFWHGLQTMRSWE